MLHDLLLAAYGAMLGCAVGIMASHFETTARASSDILLRSLCLIAVIGLGFATDIGPFGLTFPVGYLVSSALTPGHIVRDHPAHRDLSAWRRYWIAGFVRPAPRRPSSDGSAA
jgi:hypothetical protein